MTVSTLIKRLAEFTETESGSGEVEIYNPITGETFTVEKAEKSNFYGKCSFTIEIKEKKGGD